MFGMLIFEKENLLNKKIYTGERGGMYEQYCLIKMNKTDGPPQGFILVRPLQPLVCGVNIEEKRKSSVDLTQKNAVVDLNCNPGELIKRVQGSRSKVWMFDSSCDVQSHPLVSPRHLHFVCSVPTMWMFTVH